MKKDTLRALKNSIKKWERITNGKGQDDGGYNCSLCQRFKQTECTYNDEQCPVTIKTGKVQCEKSPYIAWQNHQESVHKINCHPHRIQSGCKGCVKAAKKEVDFLKSLLPVVRKKRVLMVRHQKEPFDLVIKFTGEEGDKQ